MPYSINALNVGSDTSTQSVGTANLGVGRAITCVNYNSTSIPNVLISGGSYASKSHAIPSTGPQYFPYVCTATNFDPASNTVSKETLWSDGSAIWQSGFGDFSANFNFANNSAVQKYSGLVKGIAGVPSALTLNGVTTFGSIYAGGGYASTVNNGTIYPFVAHSEDRNVTWSDASAIWQATVAFDSDFSRNTIGVSNLMGPEILNTVPTQALAGIVNAVTMDKTFDNVYAGGSYSSTANKGNMMPFVSHSTSGAAWTDGSAIWQSATFTDLSRNILNGVATANVLPVAGSVNALVNDFSNNVTFAGGNYASIVGKGATYPFVSFSSNTGRKWSDGSGIWQPTVGAFDLDLSLNVANAGIFQLAAQNVNNLPFVGAVYAMTRDTSSNVYAGGCYSSTANGGRILPFVCRTSDNGLTWKDASSIWQPTTATGNVLAYDMCLNITNNPCGVVYGMSFDPSSNSIYAAGSYYSKSNPEFVNGFQAPVPFIVDSRNGGKTWQGNTGDWEKEANIAGQVLAISGDPYFTGLSYSGSFVQNPITGMWIDTLRVPPTVAPTTTGAPALVLALVNPQPTVTGLLAGSSNVHVLSFSVTNSTGFPIQLDNFNYSSAGLRFTDNVFDISLQTSSTATGTYSAVSGENTATQTAVSIINTITMPVGQTLFFKALMRLKSTAITGDNITFNVANVTGARTVAPFTIFQALAPISSQILAVAAPPATTTTAATTAAPTTAAPTTAAPTTAAPTTAAPPATTTTAAPPATTTTAATTTVAPPATTTAAPPAPVVVPAPLTGNSFNSNFVLTVGSVVNLTTVTGATFHTVTFVSGPDAAGLYTYLVNSTPMTVKLAVGISQTIYPDNNNFAMTLNLLSVNANGSNNLSIVLSNIPASVFVPVSQVPICFQKGTRILTPSGYVAIEELKAGDSVSVKSGRTEIVEMVHFIGDNEECPLYVLPKDSIKKNMPIRDLYMSNNHAFKDARGKWHHMKCSAKATQLPIKQIEYYNIVTSDYFAHTLVAEGLEVETCFKDKEDGILMMWSCEAQNCIPLKCTLAKKDKLATADNSPMMKIKKGIENKVLWAYNKDKNMSVPMNCNQVNL